VNDPDESYQLDVQMGMGEDSIMYNLFNNVSYKEPLVPTLLTALSAPSNYATDVMIYGTSTNSFVLGYNKTIQLVVNNLDVDDHPCKCPTFKSS
jgi:iron transport multicopper oxidase